MILELNNARYVDKRKKRFYIIDVLNIFSFDNIICQIMETILLNNFNNVANTFPLGKL